MKFKKCFTLALNILLHSRLRSWLTIIGIVIGIAAVVSIISISEGAKQNLQSRLSTLGADIITVSPGASRASGFGGSFRGGGGDSSAVQAKNITARDITAIKSVQNVKYVNGEVSGRTTVKYSIKSISATIRGEDTAVWKDITTDQLESGRYLDNGDSFSAVIGGNIAHTTFDAEVPLNAKIIIGGKEFKVVGILKEGSAIYVPIETARDILDTVGDKEFSSLSVKIEDVNIANETVNAITKKLMLIRGILKDKDKDFTVSSPISAQETLQQTLQTTSLFLGAIAAISLIVGAIGIANTMFTSVLERTKDIGVMKALGATNKDILLIFLLNSGLIGLVGGLGGIILGIFGSGFIGYLEGSGATGGGLGRLFGTTAITPQLLIYSLLFSIIIGMIAGVIPAYRASKLDPVEALRYE